MANGSISSSFRYVSKKVFQMACDCLLKAVGTAALAYISYRLLIALRNIFVVYLLPQAVDLHEKAGAKWAGLFILL